MSSRLRAPDSLDTRICTGRVFTPKRSMPSVNIAFGDTPQPSSFCVRGLSKNSGANRPLDHINSSADSPKMHTLMTVAPPRPDTFCSVWSKYPDCAPSNQRRSRVCPGLRKPIRPATLRGNHCLQPPSAKPQDCPARENMHERFDPAFSAQSGYFDQFLGNAYFVTPFFEGLSTFSHATLPPRTTRRHPP